MITTNVSAKYFPYIIIIIILFAQEKQIHKTILDIHA